MTIEDLMSGYVPSPVEFRDVLTGITSQLGAAGRGDMTSTVQERFEVLRAESVDSVRAAVRAQASAGIRGAGGPYALGLGLSPLRGSSPEIAKARPRSYEKAGPAFRSHPLIIYAWRASLISESWAGDFMTGLEALKDPG